MSFFSVSLAYITLSFVVTRRIKLRKTYLIGFSLGFIIDTLLKQYKQAESHLRYDALEFLGKNTGDNKAMPQ